MVEEQGDPNVKQREYLKDVSNQKREAAEEEEEKGGEVKMD